MHNQHVYPSAAALKRQLVTELLHCALDDDERADALANLVGLICTSEATPLQQIDQLTTRETLLIGWYRQLPEDRRFFADAMLMLLARTPDSSE